MITPIVPLQIPFSIIIRELLRTLLLNAYDQRQVGFNLNNDCVVSEFCLMPFKKSRASDIINLSFSRGRALFMIWFIFLQFVYTELYLWLLHAIPT